MLKRIQLIRLAHANPELQPRLLQAIEAGMEFETAEELAQWVRSAGRGRNKAEWMKKYEELTGVGGKKPQDFWDTATHLFNQRMSPEDAAKRFKKTAEERVAWTELELEQGADELLYNKALYALSKALESVPGGMNYATTLRDIVTLRDMDAVYAKEALETLFFSPGRLPRTTLQMVVEQQGDGRLTRLYERAKREAGRLSKQAKAARHLDGQRLRRGDQLVVTRAVQLPSYNDYFSDKRIRLRKGDVVTVGAIGSGSGPDDVVGYSAKGDVVIAPWDLENFSLQSSKAASSTLSSEGTSTMIARTQLIRLAHANPDIQPRLLQAIEAGMEFKTAEELVAWVRSAKMMSKREAMGWMQRTEKKHKGDKAAYWAEVKKAVEDKTIPPSAVVGGGYKDARKVALKWLDDRIAEESKKKSAASSKKLIEKAEKLLKSLDDEFVPQINALKVELSNIRSQDTSTTQKRLENAIARAEAAKRRGKAASDATACGEGGGMEREIEVEVETVNIDEMNINMGGHDDDWTTHLTDGLLDKSDAGMMLAAGPDLVQSYLNPDDGSTLTASESPFPTTNEITASAPSTGDLCPANPPKGMRVQFANTIEAMMSYSDAPEPGTLGAIVEGRTDGRLATNFDGRVFVKWDNGPTQAIVASHLLVAEPKGKTASRNKTANRIRVASIDALLSGLDGGEYVKLAEDTLVHRATKDLWSLRQDSEGFVIERLFDDTGSPLKLG